MMIRRIHTVRVALLRAALPAAFVLTASCGGGGDGGAGPSALVLAKSAPSGDAQVATVGQPLGVPLRVRATRGGSAAEGVSVAWRVTQGGGSVSSPASTTDAEGFASVSWTLGATSGQQAAEASAAGTNAAPVAFTATASADIAASLALFAGNNQAAPTTFPLAASLRVIVRDRFANPVGGVGVAWAVTAGAGVLSAPGSTTDAAGVASVALTVGAAVGPVAIAATAAGLTGSPVAFAASAIAAADFTAEVDVRNNFFSPASITIPAGASVRWTFRNTGGVPHNVSPIGQPALVGTAGNLTGEGSTHLAVFALAGTYRYDCTIHAGMTGTVVVQ